MNLPTDHRISLTRILAVNWYGFRQILDVSGHTLVAGAFGTGKTALLDLLQYVLLGRSWKPNRAAAGNTQSRSLVSYCLCDTNTMRHGEPHYTRASGVTFIGLEFTWPMVKGEDVPRRETWGIRIEYSSPTADPHTTYFYIPERIEWDSIAPDGRLLDEDSFRTWMRREYGREYLFPRQQDFLAEMAAPQHLYFERDQFRKTLPKAIAFEPEENVEKFIREFILEENPIDVRDVRAAVGAYRETHDRLQRQEDEAGHLRRVCEADVVWQTALREAGILQHAARALEHAQIIERMEEHRLRLEILRRENADDLQAKNRLEGRRKEVAIIVQATRLEVSADPEAKKLESLERDRNELHEGIRQIEEAKKTAEERFIALHQRWHEWLHEGRELSARDPLADSLASSLQIDEKLLEQLAEGGTSSASIALGRLAGTFLQELWPAGTEIKRRLDEAVTRHEARLRDIAVELESLDRREQPGSFPVFRAIREAVSGRAEQLARLVEVKSETERWWPALELFLGSRRWVIVVAKDDYHTALEALRRTVPGREKEALLNPDESDALRSEVNPSSLAAKVDVTDSVAAPYVNHLLGGVLCVESAEELDAVPHDCAITPDGILKQKPLRRQLRFGKDVPLTLGHKGLERLRASRENEQISMRHGCDRLKLLAGDFNAWLDRGMKGGLGDTTLPDRSQDFSELPAQWAQWRSLGETIQLLRTPERTARLERLQKHESELAQLHGDIRLIEQRLGNFQRDENNFSEKFQKAEEEAKNLERELQQLHALLPPGITREHLGSALEELREAASTWQERLNQANSRIGEIKLRANKALNERANARRDLIQSERHPEYRFDFDPEESDNTRWATRLRQLEDVELPKFRTLAAERRGDWERRLRESVLGRLQERLDKAGNDIRILRDYLARAVGRYRYSISQRRDPAYQTIWQLIDSGFEPTDELLQASRSTDVQVALDELMRAVEASGDLDDRSRRLLDYRHYHRYDIEMVPSEDPSAPAISLGRSLRSLSGGENQAPFFLSMLAAFRRVYDLGSERSQHLGLVVMDEAFSKLSGDGVEDCLKLARNFQLQLILAFPIERLGVMAPYAETVIICRKEEQRDAQGFITRVDNIPQRLTMAEALDAVT